MKTLENDRIQLQLGADGRSVLLHDKRRQLAWRLDPARQTFQRREGTSPESFPAGSVEKQGEALLAVYPLPDGTITVRWELAVDHVRLTLTVTECDDLISVDLPGAWRPEKGRAQLLLPAYQGVLYHGGDSRWEQVRGGGGHGSFSLSMAAMLTARGALLATAENLSDWQCSFGEDDEGPWFNFQMTGCPVNGWYEREVRLYPVESSLTAIAKRYRKRLQERGEFVLWAEKIACKPILENLFGALVAFIGYNHSPEIDYVAGARRLNESGFDRVLYYPVRFCHYSLDFHFGGHKPIWLPDETIRQIKAIPGAMVAPWGWFNEGMDDGSDRMAGMFCRHPDGSPIKGWRIEQQQWQRICITHQVAESQRRLAGDMGQMDWIHYDVNAYRLGLQRCYAVDHPAHTGQSLGTRDDAEWTQRLLSVGTNGNRIVSSEGFSDRYAPYYDRGAAKLWPASGPAVDFIPVPLTMLVLHDSTIHDWWELDNYNEVPGWPAKRRPYCGPGSDYGFGVTGSGGALKKAAMDALYGSPPNVFPFGRQGIWVDIDTRRTFSFSIHLDDSEVQRALQAALPVARLHRRIGKQEMVSFDLLTDDSAVQTTQFADGTRIVANVSDKPHETDYGCLPPNSWKEITATP